MIDSIETGDGDRFTFSKFKTQKHIAFFFGETKAYSMWPSFPDFVYFFKPKDAAESIWQKIENHSAK